LEVAFQVVALCGSVALRPYFLDMYQNCIYKEIKSRLNLGDGTILFRIFCLPIYSLRI